MIQTLLSRKDLAQRWGLNIKTIEKYEIDGIISRVKGIPTPRYSLESIMKIEGLEEFNPLSPVERKNYEKRIKVLEAQIESQNQLLRKYSSLGAETINFMSNLT